jgi:PAS domain S-box-containing protein
MAPFERLTPNRAPAASDTSPGAISDTDATDTVTHLWSEFTRSDAAGMGPFNFATSAPWKRPLVGSRGGVAMTHSGTQAKLVFLVMLPLLLGFAALGWRTQSTLRHVAVNGTLYSRIIEDKYLLADILPPPAYAIESWLVLNLIAGEHDADIRAELMARCATLDAQYDDRITHWTIHLKDEPMRVALLGRAGPAVAQMRMVRDRDYFPLIRAGRIDEARQVLRTTLSALYDRHRAAIDETVELTRIAATRREAEAHRAVLTQSALLGLAVLATLGLSAAIAWTVLRRVHRAHGALDLQRAQLSALINHAPAAIAMLDRAGAIIATSCQWDEQVPRLQGGALTRASMHGTCLPAERWVSAFEQCLAGADIHQEREVWQESGSERFIQWDMRPWTTPDGRIAGVTVCVQDITAATRREMELERLKDAAEQASRAKTEFLTNISHEIRTPLTAILGNTDILRETGDIDAAPKRRIELIDTISSAGQHLLTMINDILSLSKLDAGRLELEPTVAQPLNLVEDVIRMHAARARDKGLSMTVRELSPVPRRVETDPARLRQILINLVGNAVKFTSRGEITIELQHRDTTQPPTLTIDVVDTGQGIDHHHQQQLFSAFTQADGGLTRSHGGTGLGLALCRKLAQLMGGNSELVWSEPGQGSRFRVWVPVIEVADSAPALRLAGHAPDQPPQTAQGAPDTLGGRILLVEDGLDNQRLISFHLRKAGGNVEIAENGLVALEKLAAAEARGEPFGLIVSDMQMPEMDGYSLARTLRKAGNAIAIVALTAHAMDDDRRRCIEAGCDEYATKPIDRARLVETCAMWIGRQSVSPLLAAA